jgi:hypothetical protein
MLANIGITNRNLGAKIDRYMQRATEANILDGKVWYSLAHALAVELSEGSDLTLAQAASVIAHLSPKVTWKKNAQAARALVFEAKRLPGIMREPFERAIKASTADDPFDTFGPDAKKTRSFAHNICGNLEDVTVDVWIARAMGVSESALKRVGIYEGIAHCFRLAGKRYGMHPAQVQAIVWIVIRGAAF